MSNEQSLTVRPVRDRRPLSVQVYDRLVEALRDNGKPGDTIPPEVELSADLGVSRTVLREALRLLEEDGVIERGADPRRRHLAKPSARPPAFNAPLEEMLQGSAAPVVQVVRTERLSATNWSRALLDLSVGDDELLCRESLFLLDGEPVASAIELVPTSDSSIPLLLVEREPGRQQTLLSAFGAQFRSKCVPSLWRFGAGGSSRSRTGFDLVPRAHLASLTEVLSKAGRPVFLAKYLIRLDAVGLAVGDDPGGSDSQSLDSL